MTDPCAVPDRPTGGQADLLDVAVRRVDPDLPLPAYAHPGDAGADLRASVDVTIEPGERVLVPTGVALALPPGHAGFVHPRSGLAARHGISIVNRGDRIAQLVVQRVERVRFVEVDSLDETSRGDTGHGSTGGFGPAGAASPTAGESPARA